jgi:FkbM family methyltransferase
MLQRKLSTAWSVLHAQGFQGAARVSLEKAGMWWRHGSRFELGKFVGRPSPFVRLDGCTFSLQSPVISSTVRDLLLSGQHEAPERALIRRHLDPSLPLVELGGAIGVVSCIANAMLHDASRHVVVEANPALLPVLEDNRRRNGRAFTVLHRAVGYGTDAVSFPVSTDILASSTLIPTSVMIDVQTTSLAAILQARGFQQCTLVCDIEGAEIDLVREEAAVLRQSVAVLIMEVHDRIVGRDACDAMFRSLHDAGFELVERVWDTVAMRRRR